MERSRHHLFSPEASFEEVHRTRFQVVHRASHFDRALRFHFGKHGAVLPDISNGHLNILSRDSVDEGSNARPYRQSLLSRV